MTNIQKKNNFKPVIYYKNKIVLFIAEFSLNIDKNLNFAML